MPIPDLVRDAEEKMKRAVEATRHEFTLIRTGRANPSMLEHVTVSMYGTDMSLRDVATVTVPEPRQLLITPFDKNALGAIENRPERAAGPRSSGRPLVRAKRQGADPRGLGPAGKVPTED